MLSLCLCMWHVIAIDAIREVNWFLLCKVASEGLSDTCPEELQDGYIFMVSSEF